MRLVPRSRRFSAARIVARALEPLLRHTTAFRRQEGLKIDGARELALYFVLRVLTRYGTTFDPRVTIEGADTLAHALESGQGVLLVGPHVTLFHLLFRRLHDDGLAPAGITAERDMRLPGTTIVADTMQPSSMFLVSTRNLLRRGRLVCAMLDRIKHRPGRTVEFSAPLGPIIVAPALLQLALRCGARVLFTEVHATPRDVVATIHAPSSDTLDGLTREFADFMRAHIEAQQATGPAPSRAGSSAPPSRLERNGLANLAGTVWSIGLALACVPWTLRLLGAEAFGLIGVWLTLQSIVVVLDLGIAATLNREIAQLDAVGDVRQQRDVMFTLQALYWLLALIVGLSTIAIAPLVASHWVKPDTLSEQTVRQCIMLMGAVFIVQFPYVLYQSGLLGLQRHVLFNAVNSAVSTLRALAPLAVLWLVAPKPQLFFAAQIVVSALATGTLALVLWRRLRGVDGVPAGFRPALIRRVWRFGAAYTTTSLANLALLQGDNILLSALLPLEVFGYYTLAQRLGSGLYSLICSSNSAVFPHFAAAVMNDAPRELAHAYHRASQLMAVLLMPAAAVMALFAREVLTVWTGDAAAVAHTHVVLALVVVGMLFHGIAQAPFYLQVAHGAWRLINITNLVLVLTILPLYAVMASLYGATGAAAVWVVLNVGYLLAVPVMHRRFLTGELRSWLRYDVVTPLAGAVLVAGAARWLMPPDLGRGAMLGWMLAAGALASTATAALAPHIRAVVMPARPGLPRPSVLGRAAR
jgi:O-antigen/teichoic acid export membrane protein